MKIRLLQREEVSLIWQIDLSEVVEKIYVLENGDVVLEPEDIQLEYVIP